MPKAVVPFPSYRGMLDYAGQRDARLNLAALDKRDLAAVAAEMEGAGFRRNAAGKSADAGGAVLLHDMIVAAGDPSGPILSEQLGSAGFDVVLNMQQNNARTDAFMSGNDQIGVGPHCGSLLARGRRRSTATPSMPPRPARGRPTCGR